MKTERMQLTIVYKNGNVVTMLVMGLAYEEDAILFVQDRQVGELFEEPARVPLKNVARFFLEMVECVGWRVA